MSTYQRLSNAWHRMTGFSHFVWRRLIDDRCLQTAGSLTYTTLLAIVPLFTIALTLFSAFPMFGDYSNKFKSFIITNLVPDASGKIIGTYMRQFSENAERLTAMGMIGLAATALLLLFTVEKTLNQIWGAPKSRKLLSRTIIYWSALTLGPLMIGLSISLASWLSGGLSTGSLNLGIALLKLGPWLLIFLSLALVYIVIPNCYVPRSHALIAAFATTYILDAMKTGFGLYIKQFGTFKLVYGAFASFPIFLMWLYVSWVIILGGAVLSACLSYWRNDAWKWSVGSGTRFEQALILLLALTQAHKQGVVLHINTLRRQLGLGLDVSNQLLEQMAKAQWVQSNRDGLWFLAISPEKITLLEIFEQVETSLRISKEQALETLMLDIRSHLSCTLEEYLRIRENYTQPTSSALLTVSTESSPT